MEERYIIEVGTRSFKYLGACYESFDLKKSISNAIFFKSETEAQDYINTVKLLQGKKCRIRKLELKLID